MGFRSATSGTRGKWLALTAALLGWMFDGFEMGLFPVVSRPALQELLRLAGISVNDAPVDTVEAQTMPAYTEMTVSVSVPVASCTWVPAGWLAGRGGGWALLDEAGQTGRLDHGGGSKLSPVRGIRPPEIPSRRQ